MWISRGQQRKIPAAAASTLLAAATLVACGTRSDGGSGGGSSSLSITEPAKQATVSLPFTVKVDAGVDLGPTESGKHHVHLWFDKDAENYLVVESDAATITSGMTATLTGKALGLAPGEHVIHVSLRNANHSAAGVETELPVQIGTGTGTAPTQQPTQQPTESSGGMGY
jgi:hypothetical protein